MSEQATGKKWYRSKGIIVAGFGFIVGTATCIIDVYQGEVDARVVVATIYTLGLGVIRAISKEGIIL